MPGNSVVELGRDELFEQHEALRVGELEEAGEQRRDLDAGEALLAGRRVAHGDGQVQRQVRDVGERVGGIDGERREHGEDVLREQVVEVGAVVGGQIVPLGETDAALVERGHELLGEHVGLALAEVADPHADLAEQVDEIEAVGDRGAEPGRELLHQPGDPHLEELVEVLAHDGEELGPLEERDRRVLGEREDTRDEVEERELSVQVAHADRRSWPRVRPPRRRRRRCRPSTNCTGCFPGRPGRRRSPFTCRFLRAVAARRISRTGFDAERSGVS